jgi:RNA polymerase sigma-70 factor (ECF subfamily)
MQASSGVAFHGIDGNEHASSGDMELVAAARAGSGVAFEELQRRYSHKLYRRIQSITRNREDSEDALQETFLRAYSALDSFEGRSLFSSWLTRIAINSALMVLRKRRRRAEVSFEPLSESGEVSAPLDVQDKALNPEQLYDVRQRFDRALRAVDTLKVNLRTPMATFIEQDCSVKEVARTLDLSLATVKARMFRARKQLTRSTAMKERIPKASLIFGSERQYMIPDIQNRELSCSSCD